MPSKAARRRFVAGLSASLVLAGCGFELRHANDLHFKSIQLSGFGPKSQLAQELRQNIEASPGTHVVESAAQAQLVLEALADARSRGVVAYTTTGLVREVQLRIRFNFRVRTVGGTELIPPTELIQVSELSYNEGIALAKQYEEAFQFKSMQSDIVAQVMRRLAAIPAP